MSVTATPLPHYVGDLTALAVRQELALGAGFATWSCSDEETALERAHELGIVRMHRDSDERGITAIMEQAGSSQIGLTRQELLFHTDCPAESVPPRLIVLWCSEGNGVGGETTIARGQDVVELLGRNHPAALAALSNPEAAIFRTGDITRVAPIISMTDGEVLEVRLRFDKHVHFSWDLTREIPVVLRAMREASTRFTLSPGVGYALDNKLCFHGRTEYAGQRRVSRIHVGESV
jgi:hypothetical protein